MHKYIQIEGGLKLLWGTCCWLQLARSLLCRLTWLWRAASRPAAQGDAPQQQNQQQHQQGPFGSVCLFSQSVNSAQQSIMSLLGGSSREGALQGPERFFLLRSLQLLRDLLLFGTISSLLVLLLLLS